MTYSGKLVTAQLTGSLVKQSDTITRPANTTAYAAGDVVGESPAANLSFTSVQDAGNGFVVLGARIRIDVNAIPSGMTGFRLHLYDAAPTAIADNAAYNLPAADRGKYLGYITLSTIRDLGDTVFVEEDNLNFTGKLASGSADLYGILETVGAFTPSSATVYTVTLNIAGV